MNSINLFTYFLLCMLYSNHVFSAEKVVNDPRGVSIGFISITGADTVDDATENLSNKADQLGARAFRILSLGGKNKFFAVAEVYK